DEIAPIAISLPKGEMPTGGFPFIIYFHGSGGLSTAVIDAGPLQSPTDQVGTPGEGPAYVMAPHGFAMAGSALPLNPERVPGATDPRVKVVVPTGAGGYWPFMVLTTQTIPNAPNDLKLLLGTGDLTFMHPALHLLETAWEAAEPFVYMRRIARDPLPNHPSRPV